MKALPAQEFDEDAEPAVEEDGVRLALEDKAVDQLGTSGTEDDDTDEDEEFYNALEEALMDMGGAHPPSPPPPTPPRELPSPSPSRSRPPSEEKKDEEPVDLLTTLIAEARMLKRYGVFTISSREGGLQARCPFHRKNSKTDCKKFFRVESDEKVAWKRLFWWCISHTDHVRQRDHVSYDAPIEDCGIDDFIDAARIDEGPAEEVKTDVQLDRALARGSRGRGRGRDGGGRCGRGLAKGRGKAHGKHDAELPVPGPPPSSSSSVTSSSSSDSSTSD